MRVKRKSDRAPWHDYKSRCIYLLTVNKVDGIPDLCHINAEAALARNLRYAVELSNYGFIIKNAISKVLNIPEVLKPLQYCIMPDHVHILLQVIRPLDRHIGLYIHDFKSYVNSTLPILEDGYNDQILTHGRDLNTLFEYIRDNPRRLVIKRANSRFFTTVNNIEIAGKTCRCYGNIFLLNNPFKQQVVVHRADTLQQRAHNRALWEYTAGNGGVLVSPFISKDEKEVLTTGIEAGGNIIYITDTIPGEREKPVGRLFDLCAQGRLLIVAPPLPAFTTVTRQACLEMNRIAALIACPQ